MNNKVNQRMDSANHFKNGKNQMNSIKKIAFLFIACIAMCVNVSAQSELTHSFIRGVTQNGKTLKPKQIKEVMSENSEALKKYKSGQTITSVGAGVAGLSAVLVGFELGQRISPDNTDNNDNTLLAVGGVGFGVGLLILFSGDMIIKNSVTLYNSKLSANSIPYNINFGFTQTGVGLSMRF